jgi:hypothetical protein
MSPLAQILREGSDEEKQSVAVFIASIVKSDPQVQLAADCLGVLSGLVDVLEQQVRQSEELVVLANRPALLPVLEALNCIVAGNPAIKTKASRAIQMLILILERQSAVASPFLVANCSSLSTVVKTLNSLVAFHPANQTLATGAIRPLIAILGFYTTVPDVVPKYANLRDNIERCLIVLSIGHPLNQDRIIEEDGVSVVFKREEPRNWAALLVVLLSERHYSRLTDQGIVHALIHRLESDLPPFNVSMALAKMTKHLPLARQQDEAVARGVIPVLVKKLAGPSPLKFVAASTLWWLMYNNDRVRHMVDESMKS